MDGLAILLILGGAGVLALTVMPAANHPTGQFLGRGVAIACLVAIIAGIVLGIVSIFSPAQAQGRICAPWTEYATFLEERYGETSIGGGVVTERVVVQVLASAGGQSFTIVVIQSNGIACLIATGRDWQPGVLPAETPPAEDG